MTYSERDYQGGLSTDPYEFADITSNTYWDWMIHNAYFIYAAQAAAAKFAETFKEFPAIQKPNTFTVDEALAKMSEAAGCGYLIPMEAQNSPEYDTRYKNRYPCTNDNGTINCPTWITTELCPNGAFLLFFYIARPN
jgi:hypothetical protein